MKLMIVIAWMRKNLPRREHFTRLRSAFVHIAIKYSCNITKISEPQTLLEALKWGDVDLWK